MFIFIHDRESYLEPHVKQLLDEQFETLQLPPPNPAGDEVPEAENIDIIFSVLSDLHCGQGTTSSELFTSSSNLFPHSVHWYSYIGISKIS